MNRVAPSAMSNDPTQTARETSRVWLRVDVRGGITELVEIRE
jgi:hypothetical protein